MMALTPLDLTLLASLSSAELVEILHRILLVIAARVEEGAEGYDECLLHAWRRLLEQLRSGDGSLRSGATHGAAR